MLDIITTLLESLLISYGVNYFCNDKNINRKTFFISFLLISIFQSQSYIYIFNEFWAKTSVCLILTYIVIIIIYRHNILNALTAISVITLNIFSISMLLQNSIYKICVNTHWFDTNIKYVVFITFLIRWVSAILQIKYMDIMCKIFQLIVDGGIYLLVIIFILNLLVISALFYTNLEDSVNEYILKNIFIMILLIFIIFTLLYIGKLSIKNRNIHKLNSYLEFKNNNLRKIKHDYGAQISYLYGLCLMERFDDLKKSLKDIIDKSNYTLNTVDGSSDSILSLALKQAVDNADINISVDDKARIYLLDIPEMDLFRVLYNIAHNAVEAMNAQGNIIAKSYELCDEIVIIIQNDGPEIPEKLINRIFNMGFTTKSNGEKEHGYGLSIVKELVEKYDGRVNVQSSAESTEFKLTFKRLSCKNN